jgi:hypothetical protein
MKSIESNRGAAVYRWNAALNRWTECHAVSLKPLWPTKPIFTPLYRLKWPFLSTIRQIKVVKGRRQRSSPRISSTKFY